jgi:hypothetical protein
VVLVDNRLFGRIDDSLRGRAGCLAAAVLAVAACAGTRPQRMSAPAPADLDMLYFCVLRQINALGYQVLNADRTSGMVRARSLQPQGRDARYEKLYNEITVTVAHNPAGDRMYITATERRHGEALLASCSATGSVVVLGAPSAVASPAQGHPPPVEPGDRVRVALADSATVGEWREARVLRATSLGVLLSGRSFGSDTVAVPLSPGVRVQVWQRSSSRQLLGAVVGLGLGVGTGALVPGNTLGTWWGERTPGHRAEMVYFGMAGTVLGWVVTWIVAPGSWRDLHLAP